MFLIASACLFMITACNEGVASRDVFGEVIIEVENSFRFQDIDWYINKELIEEELSEFEYVKALDRLDVSEEFDDGEVMTLYELQDQQFVAGRYIIMFDDESDYEAYLSEVHAEAGKYISEQEMMNESLDILLDGQSVRWVGNDKSYFQITPSGSESPSSQDHYMIEFSVTAPTVVPRTLKTD